MSRLKDLASLLTEEQKKALEKPQEKVLDSLLIIGVRQLIKRYQTFDNGSHDGIYWEIIACDKNKEIWQCSFSNYITDCYSGYIAVTWGTHNNWIKVSRVGILHYVPLDTLRVFREFKKEVTEDCTIHTLVTLEGETVAWEDDDAGNYYYPAGSASLNKSLFESTSRLMNKRPVYVFSGDSALGKTTLALSSKLTSYEVESNKELPETLSEYDIIVCSPKSEETVETNYSHVLENLHKDSRIKIVEVKFS